MAGTGAAITFNTGFPLPVVNMGASIPQKSVTTSTTTPTTAPVAATRADIWREKKHTFIQKKIKSRVFGSPPVISVASPSWGILHPDLLLLLQLVRHRRRLLPGPAKREEKGGRISESPSQVSCSNRRAGFLCSPHSSPAEQKPSGVKLKTDIYMQRET